MGLIFVKGVDERRPVLVENGQRRLSVLRRPPLWTSAHPA